MDEHVTELTNTVLSVSYFRADWHIRDGIYLLDTAIDHYTDDLGYHQERVIDPDDQGEGLLIHSWEHEPGEGRLFIMDGVKGAGIMTRHSLMWFSVNDWVFFDNDPFNEFHAPDCTCIYDKGFTRNAFADFLTRELKPQTIHIKANTDSGLVFGLGHDSWSYTDFTNALSFDNPEIHDVCKIVIYSHMIGYQYGGCSSWGKISL